MRKLKSIPAKTENQEKPTKNFKPLTEQQLESIIGGPETSRGTETTVQRS